MPAARRASRGERTRHEILDAATEHFARHGYEGARIEAIAEDAHLGGPALLYHVITSYSIHYTKLYEVICEEHISAVSFH